MSRGSKRIRCICENIYLVETFYSLNIIIDQNDHIVGHIDPHDKRESKLRAIVPPIAMKAMMY